MNNQRVFLLGATGYIGRRVATQLISDGFQVDALVRNPNRAKLLPLPINIVVGDLFQPDEWIHHVDTAAAVINVAFPNHGDGWAAAVAAEKRLMEQLADRLQGRNTKLILSNGTAFLGDSCDSRFDETATVVAGHPAEQRGHLLRHTLSIVNRSLAVIELRLASFVYGFGGSVFIPVLQKAARKHQKSIYVDNGNIYASTIHVDAVARAYVCALRFGKARETYHIAGDEEPTIKDIAQAVAVSVGGGCEAVSVSTEEAMDYVDPFTALFLAQNNRLDSQKARRELNWSGHTSISMLWDIAHGSYSV